jgi:hypothetical protein
LDLTTFAKIRDKRRTESVFPVLEMGLPPPTTILKNENETKYTSSEHSTTIKFL